MFKYVLSGYGGYGGYGGCGGYGGYGGYSGYLGWREGQKPSDTAAAAPVDDASLDPVAAVPPAGGEVTFE